jgi:hypothetical protein
MAFSVSVGSQSSHLNVGTALAASARNLVATLEKSQGISLSGQTQQTPQTQPARQDRFSFSLDNSANSTIAALASGQAGRGSQIEQELEANMMSAQGEGGSAKASPYPEAPAPTRASMQQALQAAGGSAISQAQAPSANSITKLFG